MPEVFTNVLINFAVKPLVTLTNGATIDPTNAGIVPVTSTANITGLLIGKGNDGQQIIIQNQGGFTLSFASLSSSGTVAGVTSGDFISAYTQRRFVFFKSNGIWWRVSGWALYLEGA